MKYADSENIKADCVNTVVFKLTSNRTSSVFFLGYTQYIIRTLMIW